MMAPSLVVDADGAVRLAVGSGGSKRIRTALAQVIAAVVDQGRPLADAVEAPRLHWDGAQLHVEPGWPDEVLDALEARWPRHAVAAARPLLRWGAGGRARPGRGRRPAPRRRRAGEGAWSHVGRTAYACGGSGHELQEGRMGLFSRKKDEAPQVIDLREPEPEQAEVGLAGAVPGVQWPWVPGSHRSVPRGHVHPLHAVLREVRGGPGRHGRRRHHRSLHDLSHSAGSVT